MKWAIKIFEQILSGSDENFYSQFHVAKNNKKLSHETH